MTINTATLSGNVGQQPEIRYTPNGNVIASFSLAVQGYGQGEKKTLWFACKSFSKTAEVIGEYVHKGSPVTVSGSLDIEEWQDQNGNQRSRTVLIVRDIQLPPKIANQA